MHPFPFLGQQKPHLSLLLAALFLSWVLGSRPWLSSSRILGAPSLAVFFTVPGCFLSSRPPDPCSSAHLLADCFSDLLSPVSFEPTLDFDSLASSRLTATFWSLSTSCYFRAAPCATSRLVCSSSSILW